MSYPYDQKLPDEVLLILKRTLSYIQEVGPREIRGFEDQIRHILLHHKDYSEKYEISNDDPTSIYLFDYELENSLVIDYSNDTLFINAFDEDGKSITFSFSKNNVQQKPLVKEFLQNTIAILSDLLHEEDPKLDVKTQNVIFTLTQMFMGNPKLAYSICENSTTIPKMVKDELLLVSQKFSPINTKENVVKAIDYLNNSSHSNLIILAAYLSKSAKNYNLIQ